MGKDIYQRIADCRRSLYALDELLLHLDALKGGEPGDGFMLNTATNDAAKKVQKERETYVKTLMILSEIEGMLYSRYKDTHKSDDDIREQIKGITSGTLTEPKEVTESTTDTETDPDTTNVVATQTEAADTADKAIQTLVRASSTDDPTSIIGKISELEETIMRLRSAVDEMRDILNEERKGGRMSGSLFKGLQEKIAHASKFTGNAMIRGVRHTVEEYPVSEDINTMFSGRFKNLKPEDIIFGAMMFTKDEDVAAVKNGKFYRIFTSEHAQNARDTYAPLPASTMTANDEMRFITLTPTTPLSLSLPSDKAMSLTMNTIFSSVTNGTYTFHTHKHNTYDEVDTGKKIDLSTRKGQGDLSTLEKTILLLSLEHLDVIYQYLMDTYGTTRNYIAILPTTVFGMNFPKNIFREDQKDILGEIGRAYYATDMKSRLPLVGTCYVKIGDPMFALNHDYVQKSSKKQSGTKVNINTLPSRRMKSLSHLSQIYVRFARQADRMPQSRIGLQDALTGDAKIVDFPQFIATSVVAIKDYKEHVSMPVVNRKLLEDIKQQQHNPQRIAERKQRDTEANQRLMLAAQKAREARKAKEKSTEETP